MDVFWIVIGVLGIAAIGEIYAIYRMNRFNKQLEEEVRRMDALLPYVIPGLVDPGDVPALPPWHEVLGVSKDAPLEAIREAYQRIAEEVHPGLGGAHSDLVRFVEASVAYELAVKAREE